MKPKTRKAVVLAAGRGTRMQQKREGTAGLDGDSAELAEKGLKGLIPVAGVPFLDHLIMCLTEAGCEEVILVVSPGASEMQHYVENAADRLDVRLERAFQREPLGTADAVLAAEKAVDGDSFLLCNCDNLYPVSILRRLVTLEKGNTVVGFDRDLLIESSNIAVDRVRSFSIVVADRESKLLKVVEKPQDPEKYRVGGKLWLNMNLYLFTPEVFDACRGVEPDPERGELELTAAVNAMAGSEMVDFGVIYSQGPVYDLTGREDVRAVEEALLG